MSDAHKTVDAFIVDKLFERDDVLDEALRASSEAGLPAIQVSATQGKMLMLLAKMNRARRILEIGTLGGYSTIWLARALPEDGELVTCEIDAKHADVAQKNVERAGFASRVKILVGPALESLKTLAAPFDFTFIDADKTNNANYFERALALSRSGSVIVVDNVIRNGKVIDASSTDPNVLGTRMLFDRVSRESRVEATAIQTVGDKGWDGFLMAVVT